MPWGAVGVNLDGGSTGARRGTAGDGVRNPHLAWIGGEGTVLAPLVTLGRASWERSTARRGGDLLP